MDERMRFVIRLKDGAAVPEVVRNGILVESESAEALAAAIVRLYRSPDLRHSPAVTSNILTFIALQEYSYLRSPRLSRELRPLYPIQM
jgi:hypothetical protein